eukprot:8999304-Pyramimonas_sp.AAC.1
MPLRRGENFLSPAQDRNQRREKSGKPRTSCFARGKPMGSLFQDLAEAETRICHMKIQWDNFRLESKCCYSYK